MCLDVLMTLGIAGHQILLYIVIHPECGRHLAVALSIYADRCVVCQFGTLGIFLTLGLIIRLDNAGKMIEQARCPGRCTRVKCL